jgi:hypothetical protein
MAMDLQCRAQLDVMLREKETERVQAQNRKLTEKAEAETGKKRERQESDSEEDEIIVGNVFKKDGVTWQMANGRICAHCTRVHQNCFWQDAKRAQGPNGLALLEELEAREQRPVHRRSGRRGSSRREKAKERMGE